MDIPFPVPAHTDAGIARDVFARPLANTHDHLFPEKQRIELGDKLDWTMCMDGYAVGVLQRAGMPKDKIALIPSTMTPEEKWDMLCQSYPNAYADLGWVWQLDPMASARFVRQFVTACGPKQLLLFGGDTGFAETSFGYSLVARLGLATAVTRLLADGLLESADVPVLLERLMTGNARECFRLPGKAQ